MEIWYTRLYENQVRNIKVRTKILFTSTAFTDFKVTRRTSRLLRVDLRYRILYKSGEKCTKQWQTTRPKYSTWVLDDDADDVLQCLPIKLLLNTLYNGDGFIIITSRVFNSNPVYTNTTPNNGMFFYYYFSMACLSGSFNHNLAENTSM